MSTGYGFNNMFLDFWLTPHTESARSPGPCFTPNLGTLKSCCWYCTNSIILHDIGLNSGIHHNHMVFHYSCSYIYIYIYIYYYRCKSHYSIYVIFVSSNTLEKHHEICYIPLQTVSISLSCAWKLNSWLLGSLQLPTAPSKPPDKLSIANIHPYPHLWLSHDHLLPYSQVTIYIYTHIYSVCKPICTYT